MLRAGVDFLAHSVRDEEVDEELIEMMQKADVCLCPTLTRELSTFIYEKVPDFFEDPFFLEKADSNVLKELKNPERQKRIRNSRNAQLYKQAMEVASTNVKLLFDGGITLALGTDTGPPGRFQGYFEHLEMELMTDAGLAPLQVLLSATGNAARCLQLEGLGTLLEGHWADLVVLDDDPNEDIRNLRSINSVWIAGNKIR